MGRPLRLALLAAVLTSAVVLTGCSEQSRHEWKNLAMPDPASEQGEHIFTLWRWAWVAALITGGITWGLMFWAMWRYHRKEGDPEVPIQTRYNLPLEIFYTIAPVIMVIVFFVHTVDTQNIVLDDEGEPDHTIYVVGQQWQWTFNYYDEDAVDAQNVYTGGYGSYVPTLVLPVGETTEFQLRSPDVIHDFGVPGFLMKMDVIPGRENHYRITPTTHRRLPGQVLRALRRLPLADALQRQGRHPRGLRGLPARPGGRRQRVRRAAAGRHQREHAAGPARPTRRSAE